LNAGFKGYTVTLDLNFHLQRPCGFTLNVQLNLPERGITALSGSSGSGKTTLLRCVAGLERAQGLCRIQGDIWQDTQRFLPTHRRALGYVFQEASLFPHLSVQANLEFGWRRIALNKRHIGFDEAVALLGVEPLLTRACAQLSGGERQRVAIARALLTSPHLLLMDEPLAALDHASKQTILRYLERVFTALNVPVLYVSHQPEEVARLAHYIVLLREGQVQAMGAAADLMTRLDLPLAHADNAAAFLQGHIAGHDNEFHLTHIDTPGGRFSLPREDLAVGRSARVQVYARDVSLALTAHHDTSILNILPVYVLGMQALDPARLLVRLALQDGQTLLARITRRSGAALELREGMELYAQVKSVALVD
jgi:molybdate transport system ATP-binding protein